MNNNTQASVLLHNGVKMPVLGLGLYGIEHESQVKSAIHWALEAGYRGFDTASIYNNESGVGKAIKESHIPRKDIFVTTKVWNREQGYSKTLYAFEQSLERLGLDYIDLYLIHWPVEMKYMDTWQALEHLYQSGKVKAIGVSNFLVSHLKALMKETDIVPMVNQIEYHPYLQSPELLHFCKDNLIQVQAWSPLIRGKVNEIPELIKLAEKYHKTPVQVALKWEIQKGVAVIPKSVKKDRINSNVALFDFSLSEEDIKAIDSIDKNYRIGPDPAGHYI